jgi:hypothetical protein
MRSANSSLGIWRLLFLLGVAAVCSPARADSNVLLAMDGHLVNSRDPNTSFTRFGRTSFGNTISVGNFGQYGSFRLQEAGLDGSGVQLSSLMNNYNGASNLRLPADALHDPIPLGSGVDAAFAPVMDTAIYGQSFDPTLYTAELKYKPLPGNQATTLQLTLEQWDGFDASGMRHAMQAGYLFPDLVNWYNKEQAAGRLDAQGFATIRNNAGPFLDPDFDNDNDVDGRDFLTWQRNNGTTASATNATGDANGTGTVNFDDYTAWRSQLGEAPGYRAGTLAEGQQAFKGASFLLSNALGGTMAADTNNTADYNGFNNTGTIHTPKGVQQMILQTVGFGANDGIVDDWEIKSVVIKKIAPVANEIVRIDGRTGFQGRYGTGLTLPQDSFQNPVHIGAPINDDYYPQFTNQLQRFDQNGFFPNNSFFLRATNSNDNSGFQIYQPSDYATFNGANTSVQIRARLLPTNTATQVQLIVKDIDGNDDAAGSGGEEYRFDLALSQFNTDSMTTITVPISLATWARAQAFEFLNDGDASITNFNLYMLGMNIAANSGNAQMEIEFIRVIPNPIAGAVPEPTTAALGLAAAGGVAGWGRRRRRAMN